MLEVDCRNLACPEPVLRTRSCIANDAPRVLAVIVDSAAARENVARFLQSRGYAVIVREDGPHWRVEATRDGPADAAPAAEPRAAPSDGAEKILVMVLSDVLGSGDDALGGKLMGNFIRTLPELGESLWRIIFLNGGVKFAVAGSPALAELQAMEKQGVSILSCGTCLEFFGLRESLSVGRTTTMLDVVTSMQVADKVFRA